VLSLGFSEFLSFQPCYKVDLFKFARICKKKRGKVDTHRHRYSVDSLLLPSREQLQWMSTGTMHPTACQSNEWNELKDVFIHSKFKFKCSSFVGGIILKQNIVKLQSLQRENLAARIPATSSLRADIPISFVNGAQGPEGPPRGAPKLLEENHMHA